MIELNPQKVNVIIIFMNEIPYIYLKHTRIVRNFTMNINSYISTPYKLLHYMGVRIQQQNIYINKIKSIENEVITPYPFLEIDTFSKRHT